MCMYGFACFGSVMSLGIWFFDWRLVDSIVILCSGGIKSVCLSFLFLLWQVSLFF